MNELMSANEVQTMSSREIAELTGKRHGDVIRDIRVMIEQLEDDANLRHEEFQQVTDARGYTSEYLLTKNQTLLLMTGYSVPLRQKLINRWMELENRLHLIGKIESVDEVAALKSEIARLKAQIWKAEEVASGERRINEIITSRKSTDQKLKEMTNLAKQNWNMRCEELQERVELEQVVQNHSEKIHALECVLGANMGIEFKR